MEVFADLFNDLTGWLTIAILASVFIIMGYLFTKIFGGIDPKD